MSSHSADATTPAAQAMTNGSGAAAILAAGVGSFMLAVLAIAADKSTTIKTLMNFYRPTGPLSGVTTAAILAWIILWFLLERSWRNRSLPMVRINRIALALLVLGLLLTFPPIADLF